MRTNGDAPEILYFAYGSNMNPARMVERTGVCEGERVMLPGYRLTFNKIASSGLNTYANVEEEEQALMWGVLYRCSEDALKKLDGFEGVEHGYYTRIDVRVRRDSGVEENAVLYRAGAKFLVSGKGPTSEYLEHIIVGATHFRLPQDYLDLIKAVAMSVKDS